LAFHETPGCFVVVVVAAAAAVVRMTGSAKAFAIGFSGS